VTDEQITEADLAELVELMRDAASAYIGGEIRRYFDLMQHADDFTLMDPFGGDTSRESGASEERIAALEAFFQGGECELDVVQTYASGNLAVLVVVERQRGEGAARLRGDHPLGGQHEPDARAWGREQPAQAREVVGEKVERLRGPVPARHRGPLGLRPAGEPGEQAAHGTPVGREQPLQVPADRLGQGEQP